ncbi:MAG: hypothetical protein KBG48_00475 [Kofleriaceae bacterium]|jgi:hypothetical protein|nr:hypothetical protein [Kofleriaceae bacterium]MBP9165818.1 hypothetical protein [Kofleriaceae bacterium]MBP9857967.1 hypothetical protein [Kofleriaceae bacterium]
MSTPRRVLTIVLALLAAAGLAVGVQGGRWWSIGAELHLGPNGTWWCLDGDCAARGLAWTGGSGLWQRAALATYAGGLVAALVLVGLAGAVAAGRTSRLVALVGAVAVVTAAGSGALFYALRPAMAAAHAGRGLALFAVGLAAAVAAVVSVALATRAR